MPKQREGPRRREPLLRLNLVLKNQDWAVVEINENFYISIRLVDSVGHEKRKDSAAVLDISRLGNKWLRLPLMEIVTGRRA